MFFHTETTDWTHFFDYAQTNVGELQPGHTVSGTVGGADAGDLIRISLAYGTPYTFQLTGAGVSFALLDDGTDTGASSAANSLSFTATHPSDNYNILVTGTGSYTLTMAGLAADYLPDHDSGAMDQAAELEIGTSVTGVINGSGRSGETDYFAFQGVAGQSYSFEMLQQMSPFGSTSGGYLQVFDAAGNNVSGSNWSASAWDDGATITFSPTQTGTYYLSAETYFGYWGAYSVASRPDGAAPASVAAGIDSISMLQDGDVQQATVRVVLDALAAAPVTGTIRLFAVDQDYSRSAVEVEVPFSVAAGASHVDVTLDVGITQQFAEQTVFVASLAEVDGAGISRGFRASDPYASGDPLPDLLADGSGNLLLGTEAGDRINGLAGDDQIYGLGGRDILRGGTGNDSLISGGGNDVLRGGGGRDSLTGQAGRDLLLGNGGRDRIDGGAGRDRLDGGAGNDRLTGGAHSDVFVFRGDAGRDVITDFGSADLIRVATSAQSLSDLTISARNGNVIIKDDGSTFVLLDTELADITEADFLF